MQQCNFYLIFLLICSFSFLKNYHLLPPLSIFSDFTFIFSFPLPNLLSSLSSPLASSPCLPLFHIFHISHCPTVPLSVPFSSSWVLLSSYISSYSSEHSCGPKILKRRMYNLWNICCWLAVTIVYFNLQKFANNAAEVFLLVYRWTEHYSLQNIRELPDFIEFKTFPGTPLRHIFTAAGDDLLDLMAGFLSVSPLNRCNCQEALQAPYFRLIECKIFCIAVLSANLHLNCMQ